MVHMHRQSNRIHACLHVCISSGSHVAREMTSVKTLQPCSHSYKHAHTHSTTHLAKYILGSVGKDSSCPVGYTPATKAKCGDAARSAGFAAGASSENSGYEGAWGHVPVGCSINADALTQGGSLRPHWNTLSRGKNNGNYIVVCTRTGRKWLCLSALIVDLLFVI